MPKLTAEESKEFELIPPGSLVSARLESVEADSYDWQGEKQHRLQWNFVVTEKGQWLGTKIRGSTSTAFNTHPKCKAYAWVTALTGRKYEAGEGLDTDDLIGLPATISIVHNPGKDDRVWQNVGDVFSVKAQKEKEAPF